ncbi:MAG: DUF692 domain-containing protein [Ferrovibrio sp.]
MLQHRDSALQGPQSVAGIGLRAEHHEDMLLLRPKVGFLEIHAENYMGGGYAPHILGRLRRDHELSVHGVGLAPGGAHELDHRHLYRLATLVERYEPFVVSEHLAWCGTDGTFLNDLLPIPYTEEALQLSVRHVSQIQDRLKRQILIENPSTYLSFVESVVPEGEFLAALARESGCGLLCDVNNIHVSASNCGWDVAEYFHMLPEQAVKELHVAGHAVNDADGRRVLIDDHGGPVDDAVWDLYRTAVQRFPEARTLVEWDCNIPDLPVLVDEAHKADRVRNIALARHHALAA